MNKIEKLTPAVEQLKKNVEEYFQLKLQNDPKTSLRVFVYQLEDKGIVNHHLCSTTICDDLYIDSSICNLTLPNGIFDFINKNFYYSKSYNKQAGIELRYAK